MDLIYHPTLGAKPQFQKAVTFLEQAASQNHLLAHAALYAIFKNYLSAMDEQKAEYWLSKTKQLLELKDESSHAYSQDELLTLALINEHTNPEKAFAYYEQSLKSENNRLLLALALTSLGMRYLQGNNVNPDYIKAREYFEKAIPLGTLYGSCTARTSLGELYVKGLGVKQDITKAIELFEKASATGCGDGCSRASYNLGLMYLTGIGVEQDYTKSFKYFEKAAVLEHNANSGDALFYLGHFYENGLGVKKDHNKALECYEKAAALGQDGALLKVDMLSNKIKVSRKKKKRIFCKK